MFNGTGYKDDFFWDMGQCSLVEIDHNFTKTYYTHV